MIEPFDYYLAYPVALLVLTITMFFSMTMPITTTFGVRFFAMNAFLLIMKLWKTVDVLRESLLAGSLSHRLRAPQAAGKRRSAARSCRSELSVLVLGLQV